MARIKDFAKDLGLEIKDTIELIASYGLGTKQSSGNIDDGEMAIFLNKLNIINYKINNDDHIWNLVHLNDTWLHLDLTWDDPISAMNITRDNYFLIPTTNLELLKDNNILPLRVKCEKVDILDYSNKPNYNQVAIYDLI